MAADVKLNKVHKKWAEYAPKNAYQCIIGDEFLLKFMPVDLLEKERFCDR